MQMINALVKQLLSIKQKGGHCYYFDTCPTYAPYAILISAPNFRGSADPPDPAFSSPWYKRILNWNIVASTCSSKFGFGSAVRCKYLVLCCYLSVLVLLNEMK